MKHLFAIAFVLALFSCSDNASEDDSQDNTHIDSTKTNHPNGITNGSVISTDTAAITQPLDTTAR